MTSTPLLIIADDPADLPAAASRCATPAEFLTGLADEDRPCRSVVNLCRDYSYLSPGYYASLLAEARGLPVQPTVADMLEFPRHAAEAGKLAELLDALALRERRLTIRCYFGATSDQRFARFAKATFRLFGLPLLQVKVSRLFTGRWRIGKIKVLSPRDIPAADRPCFENALTAGPNTARRRLSPDARIKLAVLHRAREALPPSRRATLERLADIGSGLGIATTLLDDPDPARLKPFDALFIRETTAVSNRAFHMARAAARAGMPVIDDPASIIRCTNKVFLADLLPRHGVDVPETHLVTRTNLAALAAGLSWPRVVKIPDGCFSAGVERADDAAAFRSICARMLARSSVVLAQEYVPTGFDWRIGILAGRPLFAVRYHMCAGHWQIIRHDPDGSHREGRTEAVPVEAAPQDVLDAAVRAAALIGDGLYGVDVKETLRGALVIEVNDNPNIDIGMEDAVLGDELYRILLRHFAALVERRNRDRALPRGAGGRRSARQIVPEARLPRRHVEHLSL